MHPNQSRPPKYRLYKPKNLAVVRIHGKDFYLDQYGSLASHENYGRLIAERRTGRPVSAGPPAAPAAYSQLTINELILAYWERRVTSYYVKEGRPTSEQDNIRQALRFLKRLFGDQPASTFGPLALKAVRRAMIEAGRCRRLINKDVHRIRAAFKRANGEELFAGEALASLAAVEALEKGRSEAKERPPSSRCPAR